jgi:hypothetical protein
MLAHSVYVPTVAWLLNMNWPSTVEATTWPRWVWESVLALAYRMLPRACVVQPTVEGVNSVWRGMALIGWWTVGYVVLFVGLGQLLRQLPDYVRRMMRSLRESAAALAAREVQ